jgi:ssDNA-binding Zn-finger/Zn-ribbon topoisomerase 1
MKDESLTCPDCKGTMYLKNGKFGLYYGCENYPNCKATHGARKDGRPLGVPADAQTRQLRHQAKKLFEEIIVSRLQNDLETDHRNELYAELAFALNMPTSKCNVAMMNKEQCILTINFLEKQK